MANVPLSTKTLMLNCYYNLIHISKSIFISKRRLRSVMKLTVPLLIFLAFFPLSNSSVNMMARIVHAIAQIHHFGHYIIVCSHEKSDKLRHENLFKILHYHLQFSAIVNVHIDDIDAVRKRIKEITKWRRSNIEMKSLKIVQGGDKIDSKKFADLSKKVNFGDKDVWLLFLDKTVSLEKYLSSVILPFNSQLIIAVTQNSKLVHFKAPYRVAKNFPLRITDVGSWTEANGLNLPTADVALTRKNFEGLLFRAGTWHYPPGTFVQYENNGKFHLGGYLADMWNELSERLNFTYVYYLSKDNAGSVSPNGSWNGLIGMLIRDEIDVAVVQLSLTRDRIDHVDFSVPITAAGNHIFYQDLGNQLEWGNFFRPFRIEVWLSILLSCIVITIALTFFHAVGCSYNIENYLLKQEYTILGCFLIVFRAFTNQGSDLTPESSPNRIIFYSAYLTTAVILPSYSAALISYLTIQTPYKPFDSLESMLKARTHMLSVSLDTANYNYFSEATTPLVKKVYRELIKPLEVAGRLPHKAQDGLELICRNNDLAFVGHYLTGSMYAEHLFLEHGCRITSTEYSVVNMDECLGFQKGSPYALTVNLELQKMILKGLVRRFEKQVYLRKKENHNSGFESINITHVIQIHWLLLGGYFLSIAFFVVEALSIRRNNCAVTEKKL